MSLSLNRPALAFVHDLIMAGTSFGLALYLRWGNQLFQQDMQVLVYGVPLFIIIAGLSFQFFGMYRGVWRYASMPDLLAIGKAVSLAILIFLPALFLLNRLDPIPRSVPVIQWCLLMIMLGGPRAVYRLIRDQRLARHLGGDVRIRIPVLLVGMGPGTEIFIRAMRNNRDADYRVVGILSVDDNQTGRAIHGVPVLGHVDEIEDAVAGLSERERPQRVILTKAKGNIDGDMVRRLITRAERLGLTLARLPSLTEFKSAVDDGPIALRPIALEDLLGRPQIVHDKTPVEKLITGRRVLITGAGGTIGAELTRQVAAFRPACLILADNSEFNLYNIHLDLQENHPDIDCRPLLCDVRDRDYIHAEMRRQSPEIVFHAAALKHVPMVEANPHQGALTNAVGTRNVADAARACDAIAMIQISTDKAVSPTSVMGASKRLAERYCQALDVAARETDPTVPTPGTRFLTVRFGNVLGSSGSVIPLFQRQLAHGGPLTVTDPDITRYFMTVREAVELVLQASAHGLADHGEKGRIFVLDMGRPIKIADIARQLIRLAGLEPDVDVTLKFTGLRPGEKLFEELYDPNGETPVSTSTNGVFAVTPSRMELGVLHRVLDDLNALDPLSDGDEVRRVLSAAVPGFWQQPTALDVKANVVALKRLTR